MSIRNGIIWVAIFSHMMTEDYDELVRRFVLQWWLHAASSSDWCGGLRCSGGCMLRLELDAVVAVMVAAAAVTSIPRRPKHSSGMGSNSGIPDTKTM